MVVLGVLLIIFGMIMSGVLAAALGIGGFIIGLIIMFVGMALKSLGENANINSSLRLLFKDGTIKGKSLKDIEKIMGIHTDVNINDNGKRVYKWDNILEIICDKDNVCKEVISCIYDYRKDNKNETTKK